MSEKKCFDCGKEEVYERKRCRECALIYNRERQRKAYLLKKEKGEKLKRFGTGTCAYCGKEMILNRPTQYMHKECYISFIKKTDYNTYPRDKKGQMIGRSFFKRYKEVPEGWVVHHIDENPENNEASNLLSLSRIDHNSLHGHLRRIRSAWEKSQVSMDENCWKTLIVQETTAWLEMTGANVLRISEIGQSASEPLKSIIQEEGSETMYVLPETGKAVGEDIVRTLTE